MKPAPERRARGRIPESFWARAAYSLALILAVELIGTVAMHAIEGWGYLDSFYFTSFIATGQGPPGNLQPDSPLGKVFSSILAFVSVGTVITALLFLFGPFLGRVLKAGEEKLEEIEKDVERREERQAGLLGLSPMPFNGGSADPLQSNLSENPAT